MISEFFINIIFGLVSGMLSAAPEIEWTVETSSFQYFLDIVKVAGYMLPMETVSRIVGLVCSLTLLRFVLAIPRAIWDLFPLV